MRKSIYLSVAAAFLSIIGVKAQFTSTPCAAGPLPISCASNTIVLPSTFTNSGVINPSTANGVGCNSVGSNITAGQIGGPSNTQAYDGWFTTTASAAGVVDVYAAIITGDPVVGIYSGPCGSLTLLTCDDDGGTGLDANATATGLTPGATYWVRVWDYNGGTGTYTVTTNGGTPPANDACVNATGLVLNGAVIGGTNYCATVAVSDWNDCESNTENNVWYSFTTPSEGQITVNFGSIACFGSGQGIDVSVFSGNCGAFSSYGCTSVNAGSTGSIATFTGPAGTYYVMVDGNNSGGATALCTFNVDVDFVGCPANAGTVAPATPINVCAGTNFNLSTTGSVNTNLGSNPCIGWGYWVASDPLGIFPGMSGIGNLPTGNNPAGVGGDPNYAGVWTSTQYPLANGPNPTLPWEGNGVTYYVAPVTLSNCAIGEITTNCFDIGNVTQVYMNPEINVATVINCNNAAIPNTIVTFAVAGGRPSVNGSNFTITNLGGGTLSTTTLANNGQATVTAIPNGGTFSILITDAAGCSRTVTIGPINAATYCPACGVNAGTYNNQHTGSGNTTTNSGVGGTNFILCNGDNLNIASLNNFVLPPNLNICGNPPGPLDYDGVTPGSCNPGIVFGIFTGLASTANPFNDPTFSGFGFVGQNQNFLNDGSLIAALIANSIPIVNNTFYLYPVTADVTNINLDNNAANGLEWSEDWNGDGCLDSGSPIAITMLNPINVSTVNTCNGPVITITGGHSQFFNTFYGITNTGAGTITGTPVNHGSSITIIGLTNGSPYSFTITDFNGCSRTVSGTYNYNNPTPAISNLASSFCLGDPIDPFNGTPVGVTVTTGSFNINFISDGFCNEWTWVVRDVFNTIVASGNTSTCALAPNVPLAPIVVSGLNPANGPFTLTINDSFGDGQDGTPWGGSIGSTSVINNITGNTVAFTSGNWGSTTTLNLGNFVNTTTTFSGTDVTNTGNGTASFNPNTVGTHVVTLTHNNGEGCIFTATQNVTVHPVPLLSSIVNPTICAGQTILLSNFVPGEANGVAGTGVWYVGTNNAGPLASTGAITPVNGAQYYYEYTAAGGCRDGELMTVTVNPNITPTFTAVGPYCSGSVVPALPTTSNNGYTGTWSPSISNTATTTYTFTPTAGQCATTTTLTITITAAPVAGTLSGTQNICVGGTTTFSSTQAGGTWSTSNAAIATINATTGVISGVSAGTATMTYTVAGTGGCPNATATRTVTVTAAPVAGTLSGTQNICVGGTTTFSSTQAGGTWSTSNAAIATINATTGVISGVAAGTATMTYTVAGTGGCADATATRTVTVTAAPVAGTLSGTQNICVGGTTTFSSTQAGGTWSTSNAAIATINATTGVISGVAAGTATMTYTVAGTGGCADATATRTVTVTAAPIAGTLSGTQNICVGGTTTFSSTQAGGTWSTSNAAIATINSATGVISGVSAGTATMTYTVAGTGGCPNATATRTVTVTAAPVAGTLSGTQNICVGGTTTFSSTQAGGTWSTSNAAIATINATTGAISGVSAGTATMTYTVAGTGGCPNATATRTVTVTAAPVAGTLSGTQNICVGGTTTFSSTQAGGTWSTSNAAIATINATTGVISGVAAGTATMTYTVAGTGGCPNATATRTVTVTAAPVTGTLSGTQNICVGGTTTFSSTQAGGTWSTSNAAIATINATTGAISGVSAGTATMTYTVAGTGGCADATATRTVTVNALPIITVPSPATVCIGATANLTPTTGGTWVSSNTAVATINNGGVVTGVAGGIANMTFTDAATGCSNTAGSASITVNTLPTLPTSPTMTQSACALSTGSLTGAVAAGNGTLSYSWTNSSSVVVGTTANLTNIPAGTYNLTVTDGNGCSQLFGPYSVTNPGSPAAPTVVVSDNSVCVGESFTLTASSGAASPTFQWTTPIGSSAITSTNTLTVSNAIGADHGTYSVTVTSANCTSASTSVDVTVNANPVASAGANTTVNCLNSTPSLTATGGTSYSWNTPSGTVSGATINLTSASVGGTYTVTATDANGCSDDDAITVTIDVTTPTALVAAPAQINCTTPTITLDGTGSTNTAGTTVGLTYAWTASNGGNIASGANTATPTVSSAGDYTLTVTQANGCTNAITVSVTADTGVPVANIATPGVLNCTNSTIVLNGTGSTGAGLTYAWTTTGGTIDSGASTSTATISAPGSYTLTIEASNGCTNSTSVTVTQDLVAPTTSVAAPIEVDCTNPTVTLDGSASTSGGTITYSWTTSNGTITGSTTGNTAAVTSAGDYTLTVTNTANGCTSNQQVTVTENTTLPVANAGANVNLTCASATVNLDGTASSGTGITYSWSGPSVVSGGNTATPSVGQAGTYTLTVTGSNGCTSTSTVTVIPDANAPIANAGNNMVINCNNSSVVLDGSGSASGTDITYTWTTATGNIVSGATSNQATVDAAGTYTLEVANTTNGCTSFASVNVTVDTTPPTANAGSAQVVSCTTPTVTLDGTASTGTGLTYSWTTTTGNIVGASNTATVVADAAGTYTLTVTGSNGCTNNTTVSVTGNTTVPTAAVATAGSMDCDNTPIQLDGSGSTGSNITYAWTTTNGTITSGGNTATPTVTSSGDYTLIVTGDNGCSSAAVTVTVGSADDLDCDGDGVTNGDEIADGTNPNDPCDFVSGSITLPVTTTVNCDTEIVIPEGFSPNGDGTNDVFVIANIDNYPNNVFTVLNRWGNIVYEKEGYMNTWDGTSQATVKVGGEDLPTGTYFYILDLGQDVPNGERIRKGYIFLNR